MRIADSATRGSASSAGARNSTNATSSAAAIHCASCVCAPLASAVTDRDVLAPTGNPLTNPAARLAAPSAFSSPSGSTDSRFFAASARASSTPSANTSSASASAPGASACRSASAMRGNAGAGNDAASGARWTTPRAGRSSAQDAPIAAMHASSAAGARGAKCADEHDQRDQRDAQAERGRVRVRQREDGVVDAVDERAARQRAPSSTGSCVPTRISAAPFA